MEKSEKDKTVCIAEQIIKLPDKAKEAVAFMIDNFDLIEKMCKVLPINQIEIKKRIGVAKKNEDYVSVIILCAVEEIIKNDT